MKKPTWKAAMNYIAENPDKAINRQELAQQMGIGRDALSHMFSGSKMLSDKVMKKISDFLDVPLADVKKEHYDNVEKYFRKKQAEQ